MLVLARYYWNLIRGARKWFAITLCLCLCGFALGVVMGPGSFERALERMGAAAASNDNQLQDFVTIVKHNLDVMFGSWCGSLVLGLGALYSILSIASLHGSMLVKGCCDHSVCRTFISIFPHGIIELPAFFLCNTFFLRQGLRWAFQKNGADRKRIFVADFKSSINIGLLCIFLLIIAAMIEAFATPRIIGALDSVTTAEGVRPLHAANPAIILLFRASHLSAPGR